MRAWNHRATPKSYWAVRTSPPPTCIVNSTARGTKRSNGGTKPSTASSRTVRFSSRGRNGRRLAGASSPDEGWVEAAINPFDHVTGVEIEIEEPVLFERVHFSRRATTSRVSRHRGFTSARRSPRANARFGRNRRSPTTSTPSSSGRWSSRGSKGCPKMRTRITRGTSDCSSSNLRDCDADERSDR